MKIAFYSLLLGGLMNQSKKLICKAMKTVDENFIKGNDYECYDNGKFYSIIDSKSGIHNILKNGKLIQHFEIW